uniref:Uncharacterized protein n=1 Tax=Avena sativa TaxID=4498 RepID=A0ACD5TL99_AVESA
MKYSKQYHHQPLGPQRILGNLGIMADERNQGPKVSIDMYVVCCYKCLKWRKIPTKQQFEVIRGRPEEDKWFCGRDPNAGRSCEQPADVIYDSSQIWLMDRHGIPPPPSKTERLEIIRGDLSKTDIYYVMPNGKRARSHGDVERFLKENPRYMDMLPLSSFSFTAPKIARETVEGSSRWRAAKADLRGKRSKQSSLGRVARAKSESSEDMDMSDSDYYCPSSSDGSE